MSSSGLYLVLLFVLPSLLLGALALYQYRRRREAETLNGRFAAAIDSMSRIMDAAERTQDFSLRYDNPNLTPCWKLKRCGRTDCEAYENPNLRCWQLSDVRCQPSDAYSGLFEGLSDCVRCAVYQQACSDPVMKLAEHFNNVMALLERQSMSAAESRRIAQQASKLASIGEFAAGLAHEINNPLDGIMSCMARLERDPANLAQNMKYLRLIQDALKRLCVSVQHLLEYSRKHDLHSEALDVHGVVENVVALIAASARQKAIDIEYNFGDTVPCVLGDRHYLAQALLNLALNAMSATAESRPANGARIEFSTRTAAREGTAERFVEIDVADNGPGMPADVLARVFEPFFSTKDPGKGTGLGLTIAKGIIDEHRGRIAIDSAPGKGTTVRVFLPALENSGPAPGLEKSLP